jgi:pyruvate,water dikinase
MPAIKKVREVMGLEKCGSDDPFCRTVSELLKVYEVPWPNTAWYGARTALEVYLMAEVPSNVILAEEFGNILMDFLSAQTIYPTGIGPRPGFIAGGGFV